MEFMEYRKIQYDKVPIVPSDVVALYNDLERLDTLWSEPLRLDSLG